MTHFDYYPSLFAFCYPTFVWLFLNQLLSIKPNFITIYNFAHKPCVVFKFGKIFLQTFGYGFYGFVFLNERGELFQRLFHPCFVFDNNSSDLIFNCKVFWVFRSYISLLNLLNKRKALVLSDSVVLSSTNIWFHV